jgi:ribokinase
VLVCTLGDVLLDVVVRLDEPIAPDTDAYGRTRVGAGGQAANVAAWAAALGGRGRVVSRLARDGAGRLAGDELRALTVDVVGPETDGRTGTVVSVATPDGARTMLTDRGVSGSFTPDELQPEWLAGCDVLHISGYALADAAFAETAAAAARLAPRVSVDLASAGAIRRTGAKAFAERLAAFTPEIVFAAEEEERELGEVDAPVVVVKHGARGCEVRRDLGSERHAALPAAVLDTTGAGDAFAAGFLLGGVELGLSAAARCVARTGALP